MAPFPTMTPRQWIVTAGLFLAGGYTSFVLATFIPVFIAMGSILVGLAVFQFAFQGLLGGTIRAISRLFRRNRPDPVTQLEPDEPSNPWPVRYAFLIGFLSNGTLAWILSYNDVKGYI